VSVAFAQLLRNWYSKLTASVMWNNFLGVSFLIFCGVKQGTRVKEVDLYSAFIEVPYTQGAQVRITQITPYLPLPRKHSPDGASPD